MKQLTTLPILTGLAFLFVSCGEKKQAEKAPATSEAETFVLATRNFLPPVGTFVTTESSTVMTDSALTLTSGPQELEGSATRTDAGKETREILSPDKIRQHFISKTAGGKMKINGREQSMPEKPDPLLGLAVILERNGKSWSAKLENGESPDAEQKKRLDKIVEAADRDTDFQMYGDTPRKPGDKWDVNPALIGLFDTADSVSGTYVVEFVEVKEINGVRCAVLKATYDMKGKSEMEDDKFMDLTMKGVAISHRSLTDQIDLGVEIKGDMTINMAPAPNVTMLIEGPMTMTQKLTLKKP